MFKFYECISKMKISKNASPSVQKWIGEAIGKIEKGEI
jgi:hypothetical protein